MACTEEKPCKEPMLRWYHSNACYTWYKERKNNPMYPKCEKGTACIDNGCTEMVGSSCDCSCHRISSPPQRVNQEKRCPHCGAVVPRDLLGEHQCEVRKTCMKCNELLPVGTKSHYCRGTEGSVQRPSYVDLLAKVAGLEAQKDGAYSERNKILSMLAHLAIFMGWKAGIGQHPESDKLWDKDWRTILFIEFPTGQGSWHFHDSEVHLLKGLPPYNGKWDGHSTEEKYKRLADLTDIYRESK